LSVEVMKLYTKVYFFPGHSVETAFHKFCDIPLHITFKNTHRQTAVSVTHRMNMYVAKQCSLL